MALKYIFSHRPVFELRVTVLIMEVVAGRFAVGCGGFAHFNVQAYLRGEICLTFTYEKV